MVCRAMVIGQLKVYRRVYAPGHGCPVQKKAFNTFFYHEKKNYKLPSECGAEQVFPNNLVDNSSAAPHFSRMSSTLVPSSSCVSRLWRIFIGNSVMKARLPQAQQKGAVDSRFVYTEHAETMSKEMRCKSKCVKSHVVKSHVRALDQSSKDALNFPASLTVLKLPHQWRNRTCPLHLRENNADLGSLRRREGKQ
eukprot:4545771-Pleurochrysis_carterae.AAC.1